MSVIRNVIAAILWALAIRLDHLADRLMIYRCDYCGERDTTVHYVDSGTVAHTLCHIEAMRR